LDFYLSTVLKPNYLKIIIGHFNSYTFFTFFLVFSIVFLFFPLFSSRFLFIKNLWKRKIIEVEKEVADILKLSESKFAKKLDQKYGKIIFY
jgi:hypothetical protein